MRSLCEECNKFYLWQTVIFEEMHALSTCK
jgi:hypothetical protein